MQSRKPIENDQVREVFANYHAAMRKRLLDLRDLILATADETDGVGQIVECLKWGQPAYLTERPKSGSTIRIDAIRGEDGLYGLFVHCQTRLVPIFRRSWDGAGQTGSASVRVQMCSAFRRTRRVSGKSKCRFRTKHL